MIGTQSTDSVTQFVVCALLGLVALMMEVAWALYLAAAGMAFVAFTVASRAQKEAEAARQRAEELARLVARLQGPAQPEEPPAEPAAVAPPAQPVAVAPPAQPVAVAPPPRPAAPAIPLVPAVPISPAVPSRPPIQWEALWRSAAGPLVGADQPDGLEARIGVVWFSRLGALLILIGAVIGYVMLRSGWLQASIGWAAGLALVGLSWWGDRRGYTHWAQAVAGGGVGLLYVVTTAAHSVFGVLPALAAFALMAAVTVLGTFLAVRYDAIVVGLLAMVGGFATPFLLSSGQGSFAALFTYVAILDLGLLGVAWFKRWPLYNYLLFAVSWVIWGGWRVASYTPADAGWAMLFAAVYFAIFAGVAIQYNIVHQERSGWQDLAMALVNGFVFFASGLDLLPAGPVRAGFAVVVAATHLVLGWLTLRHNREDRPMQLGFLGLAAIFLTVAVPVALSGPWISVAWALEGAALVLIGFLTEERWARPAGLTVYGIALTGLLSWETFPDLYHAVLTLEFLPGAELLTPGHLVWATALPAIALRLFTFGVSIAAFYLGVWAYSRYRGSRPVMQSLAAAASFLTLWYLTFELTLLVPAAALPYRHLAIAGVWGLYGLGLALAERWFPGAAMRGGARIVQLAALGYLLLGALLTDADLAVPAARWAAYVAVLGGIFVAEYRFRDKGADGGVQGALALLAATAGFFVGAYEVACWQQVSLGAGFFPGHHQFWTVAVWGAYAALLLLVGSRLRWAGARILAAALSGVTQVYLLAVGLASPGPGPLRFLAFLFVAPGFWLVVHAARRTGLRFPAEAVILKYTALGAAALTAYWGAAEVAWAFGGTAAPWAMVAWAGLYGLILLALGARRPSPALARLGLVVSGLGLAGFLLIFVDGYSTGMVAEVALWLRLAVLVLLLGGLAAGPFLLARRGETADWLAARYLALAAAAIGALWLWLAIDPPNGPGFPLYTVIAAEALYAAALAAAGFRLHWHDLTRLGMALGAICLFTGLFFGHGAKSHAIAFGWKLGALLIATAAAYAMAWRAERTEPHEALGWLLGLGTAATSGLWAAWELLLATGHTPVPLCLMGSYGVAVLGAGLWLERPAWRNLGLLFVAFATLAGPVAAVDPGASGAGILAVILGTVGATYIAAWMVRRPGREAVSLKSTEALALGGAVITLIWIWVVVRQAFGLQPAAGEFALSLALAVYGLAVLVAGFGLGHRRTRLLGMGVLVLTLGKVLALDLWRMELVWRVWVGVGIGVVLVLASLGYQRFMAGLPKGGAGHGG